MNVKRFLNIKKRNIFYAVIAILFLLLSLFAFDREHSEKEPVVSTLALSIIDEYRLKNGYAGLVRAQDGFVVGDKTGEALSFGAKSFFIIADKINNKKCLSLLSVNLDDLTLISVEVNGEKFVWGDGWPVEDNILKDVCIKENKIIWNFS
ncbi:MAG: hypothetical protein R3Y43_07310 [Alphaproteobacteria bacterium]